MFSYRDTREGDLRLEVAFTDSSIDLQELRPGLEQSLSSLEQACGVRFARMNQVHGDTVLCVAEPGTAPADPAPDADALFTSTVGLGLMVRVADCVPLLLADQESGVCAAVHAGRAGVALDIVGSTLVRMRAAGARDVEAWVGPHVCGGCYEVPAGLRDEVAALVPATRSETTWGTPSLDLGAGVRAQLLAHGVDATEVGRCTREDVDLHSYRRDGADAGRLAGLIWTVPA